MSGKPTDGTGRRSRLARGAQLALASIAAAGLGLLASGCGGSPGQGVAQVGSAQTTTADSQSSGGSKADPAAYSACMRRNGVANFPDPDSSGGLKITSGVDRNGHKTGVDVNAPQFKKAQRACQALMPKGGRPDAQAQAKERQQMLGFSACMRSHGVPKYPDPKFTPGGGTLMEIGKGAGVDPRSPEFQAAQKTCGKLFANAPTTVGPGESGQSP